MTNETPQVVEIDCETNEAVYRPMTPEEIAQREADAAAYMEELAARAAAEEARIAAKASAEAKLAAIGLTPEEIAAL